MHDVATNFLILTIGDFYDKLCIVGRFPYTGREFPIPYSTQTVTHVECVA